MEEIIEIFADAISGFIMLSIKLQEKNVAPAAELRPAADAVVQTTKALVAIAGQKAEGEYKDFEEIFDDIMDCVRLTSAAVDRIPASLDVLYAGSGDRADGWRRLVNATQAIASQTSRLLLVVYGAENRRLVAAGKLLLESCAHVKKFGLMPSADVAAAGQAFVEGVNKCSSDLMVFVSYVQVRAKEIEGAKSTLMTNAVATFGKNNTTLVDTCNALLKSISADTRKPFLLNLGEIEKLTREILGIIKPPEELDIFQLVQSLASQKADVSASKRGKASLKTPLASAAEALKAELQPLSIAQVDPANAAAQAASADGRAAAFLGLARVAVADVDSAADGDRRKRMQAAVADMDKERTVLKDAAAKYAADPNTNTLNKLNASARHFADLVDDFMADARPVVKVVTPGDGTRLSARAGDVEKAHRDAKAALEKLRDQHGGMNDDELHAAGGDASSKVAKFIEFVKAKQMQEGDPAEKARLGDLARELQADNVAVVRDVNAYMADRSPAKSAALKASCQKTIDDLDRAYKRIGGDAAAKRTGPMTFDEEIAEAAVDIQEAVDEYSLVPKELKDYGSRLAELMAKLAEAARNGDREAIITISREIKDLVKKVRQFAVPLAGQCADPVLADQIRTAAQAIGSFGTQLSIIASVKAASLGSSGDDNDNQAAEEQLVRCAEGIASSMRQTLFGIQSAKSSKKL